ncbi:MAG: hypothetical protein Q8M03_04945 [Legionella sp.]|nr:hypothetical protein [Legionella sp.]
MRKYQQLGVLLFCLYGVSVHGENSATPVKVNDKNNPDCVEFFTNKDGLYCNTLKETQTLPIDPALKNYEKQKIVFDDRNWQASWGIKNDTITTIEYLTSPDTVDQWQEMITSQFIPNLQNKITLEEYANSILDNLKKTGLNPKVTIIEATPDYILLEFQIASPSNLIQDELQKISKGSDGFYILHYVIKKEDMGKENRDKWVKNLKASSLLLAEPNPSIN